MKGNMAQKRATKAIRRKAVVAEKRKAELLAASLPEQVRIAAGYPIQHCLLSERLLEYGKGTLLLARGHSALQFKAAVFLLDALWLGIKDVIFSSMTDRQLQGFCDAMDDAAPLQPVEPAYARKLLQQLARWAQENGVAPVRDFAVVERLFGDVNADACETTFQFGYQRKLLALMGARDLVDAKRLKEVA